MEVTMDITTVPGDVASVFKCPACYVYFLPPILQCGNGHLICINCRFWFTRCPECGVYMGNIRSLAMEKFASAFMFPCNYSTYGCAVSVLFTERKEHEERCAFRQYSCPFQGGYCEWEGYLEQMVPHLVMSHNLITFPENEVFELSVRNINQPAPTSWSYLLSRFGHDFIVVLCKLKSYDGHQYIVATVQLIGSRKQAENFAYKIKLKSQRRGVTWKGTPISIEEGVLYACKNSDCLALNDCTAQQFADNGMLIFNVSFSMV